MPPVYMIGRASRASAGPSMLLPVDGLDSVEFGRTAEAAWRRSQAETRMFCPGMFLSGSSWSLASRWPAGRSWALA